MIQNKYQTAINNIKNYMLLHNEFGDEDNIARLNKFMIEDLQQLLNNYNDIVEFISHKRLEDELQNFIKDKEK